MSKTDQILNHINAAALAAAEVAANDRCCPGCRRKARTMLRYLLAPSSCGQKMTNQEIASMPKLRERAR